MTRYTTLQNTTYTTTKKLGEGGEGAVFDLQGHPGLVAKIYHSHRLNAALAAKVVAMTSNPPEDATRKPLNHVSIAWPIDALYAGKQFVGYTMPKLKKSDDLYDLIQPQQRAKEHSGMNHRHLYRTARNLAIAIDAIHRKGYVVGDVNFKNALFNDDALITMVDCDSMQVTDATGVVHHCLVGVPEYTPADLQGVDFGRVTRTPNHDAFGLAILIFQLLMQGFHPFAGRPKPGVKDIEQAHIYCISKGIFPYLAGQPYEPPPAAPSMLCLPVLLQQQFERAFTQPTARPTPKDWANVLAMVETRLVPCPNDASHWYPSDGHCVICEIEYNVGRRQRTTPKPSATVQMQVPLPPSPTGTTGPLRPSAISKPHVPIPASNIPTISKSAPPRAVPQPKAPPASPTTVRPAQPTPTMRPSVPPQTLPPLVAPTSAPRVNTTIPTQSSSAQSRTPKDLFTMVRAYIQTNRMIVIPVAVIVMALVVLLMSNMGGTASPPVISLPMPTDSAGAVSAAPTVPPVALATAIPEPTSVAAIGSIECTPNSLIAAHWPMLPASVQEQMTRNLGQLRTKPYTAAVITDVTTNLRNVDGATFGMLQAACGSEKLIQYNPLRTRIPESTLPTLPCTGTTCTIVAPEYRLVMVKIADANKEVLYSSNALIEQFFTQNLPPSLPSIALLSDEQSTQSSRDSLLIPFVQIPLLKMQVNNPIWPTKITGTEQKMTDVREGAVYFSPDTGVTIANTAQPRMTQYFRIVAIPDQRWTDGTRVTVRDYIHGYQADANGTQSLIADISAVDDASLQITYLPGLPREFADAIAPVALHGDTVLGESMGNWTIGGTPPTYVLTHKTDPRKSFTFVTQNNVQQFTNDIRMGIYDMVIVDAAFAPGIVRALGAIDVKAYRTYLVPNGTTWVLQQ